MPDEDRRSETINVGIALLALDCRRIFELTSMMDDDHGGLDKFDNRGNLKFLSMMSLSIGHILNQQDGCAEIARIWKELSNALNDVAGGKNSDLFQPIKEPGAQPRRISVDREMQFSIASAVYDLAELNAKNSVRNLIAKKLKVKPQELKNYGKNLMRSEPNIRSSSATELYEAVYFGHICVDQEGCALPGNGKASPVSDWLKWFDNL